MLDTKHIGNGFVIDDSSPEKFILPETDAILAQRCKPRPRDILISSRGTIGKIAIVNEGQNFNIMGNIILIRLPSTICREFAAFYLHSQVIHIEAMSRGVAQKGLYLGQIREFRIPLPPLAKQQEIAKKLRNISCQVENLKDIYAGKLDSIAALRQSILQKAFAGELPERMDLAA